VRAALTTSAQEEAAMQMRAQRTPGAVRQIRCQDCSAIGSRLQWRRKRSQFNDL